MDLDDRMTIGALADAAGISVRTIRHYEAEGLLTPSARTPAGHRVFDRGAALRLYRIVALRRLGLAVADIGELLEARDEQAALRTAAIRHLADLDRQIEAATALRTTVAALVAADDPDPTTALEATAMTIELDRITTGAGDDGSTSAGGGRVRKSDARVEALGALDELNARVGHATALDELADDARTLLVEVQHRLFDVGADLVRARGRRPLRLDGSHAKRLTTEIAQRTERQRPLDSFVLPGGGTTAAALHLCRTAARTAERRVVALDDPALVDTLAYLNRLSDLCFVLARDAAEDEVLWEPLPAPDDAETT